jgi:uncharacterized membrane protein
MIWDRKRFKRDAKKTIRKNYMAVVAVCFMTAFIAGEGNTSLKLIKAYDSTRDKAIETLNDFSAFSNRDIIKDLVSRTGLVKSDTEILAREVYVNAIEDLASNNSILFRTYETNMKYFAEHQIDRGTVIALGSLTLILFSTFAGNVLIVGKRRFFMENRIEKGYETPIRAIIYSFRRGLYLKTVKIMFLKHFYNILWALTVVGGFVKFYEYRAIPYILATNTRLTTKEIFSLSKSIMNGYKWKSFVMDLTFAGWKLLQILTLGVAGIFFVVPYTSAARTEAYIAISNEAIALKKPYSECIKNPLFKEPTN